MAVHLKFLIKWPPQLFKETYPSARCIIDCSEVFIERPLSFQVRAQIIKSIAL